MNLKIKCLLYSFVIIRFVKEIKCLFHKPCEAKMLGGKGTSSYLCHQFFNIAIMTDYEYILKQARKL